MTVTSYRNDVARNLAASYLKTPDPTKTQVDSCFFQFEYSKENVLKYVWVLLNHQLKDTKERSGHSVVSFQIAWNRKDNSLNLSQTLSRLLNNFDPALTFKMLLPQVEGKSSLAMTLDQKAAITLVVAMRA